MKSKQAALLLMILVGSAKLISAQEADRGDRMQDCPMHAQHAAASSHYASVDEHGDDAMGFSHEKTTHHFLLWTNGGRIEVTANELADKASIAAIRTHLSHIAVMFANGDFAAPIFIHDGIPPGGTTMQLLKSNIRYKYEEISLGGRVRMESNDPVAIAAIHDFLRFQISEHRTGNPLKLAEEH